MDDEQHALVEADDFSIAQARREQALAEAQTIPDLQAFAQQAEAARRLLRSMKRKLSEQNEVAHLRLRALRKLGALLAAMPKHQGSKKGWRLHDVTTTLADLGISKRDSAKWQRFASIPQRLFDETCKKVIAT